MIDILLVWLDFIICVSVAMLSCTLFKLLLLFYVIMIFYYCLCLCLFYNIIKPKFLNPILPNTAIT